MSAHKLFKWYFVFVLCIEVKSKVCFNDENDNCVKPCQAECFGGNCNALNECVCYERYERHLTLNTCVRKCKLGFKKINNVCMPQCSSPCHGGQCVASDKCSCDSGWELNERQECVLRVNSDPSSSNHTNNDDTTTPKPEESKPSDGNSGSHTANIEDHLATARPLDKNEGPYNVFYQIALSLSVVGNVALILVVLLFLRTKNNLKQNKTGDCERDIEHNYVVMNGGAQQNNRDQNENVHVDEYIPIYDYVETPLACHASKSHVAAGVHRRN